MKILHVTPCYYPATWWGGPIWSTKAICDGIAAEGDMDLRVLTTDAASPKHGARVTPATFDYPVHYARRVVGHSVSPGLLARLPAAIAWADVVHLTGTYNAPTLPTLALCRAMSRPLVWSPRGALQATREWAQSPRRRRKQVFEHVAQRLRPPETVLHVTAPMEAAQSADRLQGIRTVVIPNTVDLPRLITARTPFADTCRLMYLGRLHPKKGLDILFEAMGRLPARFTLDVYGDGDPAYVTKLTRAARQLHGRVRMHGHVEGDAKARAFAKADLFVLPSYSENFGIVIAEALAHAVPVLTTKATPWAAVEREGCGRCVDLARVDLCAEIRALATADLPAMGARGRAWMQRDFAPSAMVAQFAALYRSLAFPAATPVTA